VDLLEYQGKSLLARLGVSVPQGCLAQTPEEAEKAAQDLGGPVVVKAQVQVGGRDKAGGIKRAETPQEAGDRAREILGMRIGGHSVGRVWVEQASKIKEEYYASFMLDRSVRRHLGILSARGGVDIEEVAASDPEAVVKIHIDPVLGLTSWQATELVYRARLAPEGGPGAVEALRALYQAFVAFDCDLVEVNPLILTMENEIIALDAKVTIDDSALFRHPDFAAFADAHVIDPIERMAREKGLNFIALEGEVGIVGNGAGLVMSTLDVVNLVGGKAANFLDVGGGAGADTVGRALEVLTQDPSVRVVLVNIFGGITRGDLVARGIVEVCSRLRLPWPIVVRLDGTNAEEGRRILSTSSIENLVPASTMREAAEKAVRIARGAAA